jgi:hypothetical protein
VKGILADNDGLIHSGAPEDYTFREPRNSKINARSRAKSEPFLHRPLGGRSAA